MNADGFGISLLPVPASRTVSDLGSPASGTHGFESSRHARGSTQKSSLRANTAEGGGGNELAGRGHRGWSILAERVLDGDPAVPERKKVATGDLYEAAIVQCACEGPLGHSAVSLHKVPSAIPSRIWILGEHCLVRRTDGARPFVSLAVDALARGSLEYAVFRHHGHQSLDVMTIPGIGERFEQRFQISI
jgi:hypothetical protein